MASLGGLLYIWVQMELQICSPKSRKITWNSKKITWKVTRKSIFTEWECVLNYKYFYKATPKINLTNIIKH